VREKRQYEDRLTELAREVTRKRLIVLEASGTTGRCSSATGRYAVDFDVGFFSSPMIDNTRLSNDQRVAIVLTDMSPFGANVSLVYFPGSRASLREKPYYEEILRKLAESERPE